ncbi:ABC transporter ATP-binding protein [Aestuariispira ectoiniformans]|uniref:ABC transporter ATP-binding protein n=1 Tax=Aestuariispira ectoiniformans TaxID=2775080 RepID=UPI00223B6C41|nr:ABC transporter ATP-binding protein [Aestuariispira ectoiniformans]
MSLLDIKNLTVEFETAHGMFRAVDGVDLEVNEGEIVSIVGESGSGKSVSMLALMGLLPWTANITADRMTFDNIDLLKISQRDRRKIIGKDIAMIFQEPMTSLNPCFTVGYQIMEVMKKHLGGTRKELEKRAIELLGMVGIPAPESRLKTYPHQMSGGMNQRIMIAMMIACNPRLLIADEPTTALDVTIQAQILELLVELQQEKGMALVLITHDMGVVAETAQEVVVQYAGQQVERQHVKGLFDAPQHPYTHALLSALPERVTGNRLPSIPGVVPGLLDRPTGCLFNPRCQFATEHCRQVAPEKHTGVLCHYPLVDGKPTGHPDFDKAKASGGNA